MMEQVGVFRVNCMDCLDRTNVVQGLLALESLQDQLMVGTVCRVSLSVCQNGYATLNAFVCVFSVV